MVITGGMFCRLILASRVKLHRRWRSILQLLQLRSSTIICLFPETSVDESVEQIQGSATSRSMY